MAAYEDNLDPTAEDVSPPETRRNRSGWIAAFLVLLLVGWMASGMLGQEEMTAAAPPRSFEPQPVAVEVTRSTAQPITRALTIEGEVRPNFATPVRAEAGGVVDRLETRKGAFVEQGAVIARISPAERSAQLIQAEADLRRARRDFDAIDDLAERGYATRAREEETRAAVAAAEARLAEAEEALNDTLVRAPAAGVLNDLMIDPGEVVQAGAEVARIVDTDPLVVDVRVPQGSVSKVREGMVATVAFVTGQTREGRVRYVSANAEAATRTFAVEVEVANPDRDIPAGVSAEVKLPVEDVAAHFVSPAILSLGPEGQLGVKAVDEKAKVHFYPVQLVRAQTDGIWVAGPPEEAVIISVGQGFVAEGETVAVTLAGEDATAGAAQGMEDAAVGDVFSETDVDAEDPVSSDEDVEGMVVARNDVAGGTEPRDVGGTGAAAATGRESTDRESEEAAESDAASAPRAEPVSKTATAAEPTSIPRAQRPVANDATAVEDISIADAQRRLNSLGFEVGVATGQENPRTRLALARFQEANDLPVTGELDATVGGALLARTGDLEAATGGDGPGGTPTSIGLDDGEARALVVGKVQEALNERGFDAGPVDGALGPSTRRAISAYQTATDLPVTGALDEDLLASLGLSAE